MWGRVMNVSPLQSEMIWHCLYLIWQINFDKKGLNQLFMVFSGFYDCVSALLKYRSYQNIFSAIALIVIPMKWAESAWGFYI